MEEVRMEESWNKKRVFAVLTLIVLLTIGGYFFKTRVLDVKFSPNVSSSPEGTKKVIGVSSKVSNPDKEFNAQEAIKEKINSLKQEVAGLNIVEVASSSPQVKKIINDIKSLEQYPTNQAKEICRQICGL